MISDFKVTVKADLGDGQIREMDVRELEGPFITTVEMDGKLIETVEYRLKGRVVHQSVGILPPKH